jgi:uncharacterized membrane protein YkvA (DUF1232 family)
MEWWQYVLLSMLIAIAVVAIAAFIVWRKASGRTKALAERLQHLPWRARFELAGRLVADERMPLAVRAIPALLVLYLAMPLDIIPDFIPVLGQLDDIAVVIVAVGLFARFAPVRIIEEHIATLESAAGVRTPSR